MKCSLLIGVVMLLCTTVCRSEMREGLSGERCLGRFGWNQGGSQELRDGLLFNGVDENGLEACIGLGNNQFRMWRMDILTPEALAQDPGVKVKWLNWIAKEVEVRKTNQNYNLIYSLASPGVIVDTAAKQLAFKLKADQIRYAAYQGQGGMVVRDISEMKEGLRGQDLKANWLLCFSGQESQQRDVPLLLVLTRSPASLNVGSNKVVLAGDMGKVIVALPFGLKTFDGKETETWGKGLPEEITQQCKFWARTLLEYPVDCREFYEVDEDNREVKIEDQYEYLRIDDAWHTVSQKVAPMPPIISFARTEEYFKDHIRVLDKIESLNYPTWYGPLEGNIGKTNVSYVLPSPYSKRIISLRVPGKSPFTEFMVKGMAKSLPRIFRGDAIFMIKTGTLLFSMTDLSMILWLDPDSRQELLDVEQKNLKDFFQYLDQNTAFFKEPSTGKGFYLMRKAISPEKDTGNFRIDRMRAYDMSCWPGIITGPLYDYTICSGDRQLLQDNWKSIKKAFDAWWVVNDWAIMSASDADAGSVSMNAVDCTWDSLAVIEAMRGLAELMGDKDYEDGVKYLRARQLPVSMLKLSLQWNYLPQYGCTFADNRFFVGIGELDSRYSPRIPFLLGDTTGAGDTAGEKAAYKPTKLPWLFNHACIIWPSSGFALVCEMAPATTLKYLRKIDELCPELDDGTLRAPFWAMPQGWSDRRVNCVIYDNHLFMEMLLGEKDALRKKANTFNRATFQEQISFRDEQIFKEIWLAHNLQKIVATSGYLHAPVSLGEWGKYKIQDGTFNSRQALLSLTSTDNSPLKLRLVCREKPDSVSINHTSLKQVASVPQWRSARQGWFYEPGTLMIKTEHKPELSLEITFADWQDAEDPFQNITPSGDNLLYNPGFEISKSPASFETSGYEAGDVVFNRWQSCNPTAYYEGIVSSSGEKTRNGKLAAKLTLDKEAAFFQNVKATPGKTYQADFYFYAPDFEPDKELLKFSLFAIKGGKMRQILGEEQAVISESKDKSAWQKARLNLICPEGANIIRVQAQYQPEGKPKARKTVYIDDISLAAADSAAAAKKTLTPAGDRASTEPGLIFYASFDKSLNADFAKGDGRAGFATGLESIAPAGRSGNCLNLFKGEVGYFTDKNFQADQGSLSMWIKPDREFCEATRALVWWGGCIFWTEFDFTDYNRFTFGLCLPKKKSNAFDPYLETECGLSQKGERLTFRYSGTECENWENWHHIAATWEKGGGGEGGKDQTSFYFDGTLVNTTNNASLPPVVRGIMKLGHSDPHRQYGGLLDELRIYDRALSPEEIKKLYEGKRIE